MKAIKRVSLSSDVPTRSGRVMKLNGASSCGKSALARALQDTIEDPFWHLSIDHFREAGVLPTARIARQDFCGQICDGGLSLVFMPRQLLMRRLETIWVLNTSWMMKAGGRPLSSFTALRYIPCRSHCSFNELTRWEAARGDRPLGSTALDFHGVHFGRCYDLELQSEAGEVVNIARLPDGWRFGCRQLISA